MRFDSIRFVLVATSHPGNIGATARAMKVMGFHRLYLVSPKTFPDRQAREMSAGAYDVLDQAVVTDSLDEALRGCQLVLGTSARARDMAIPGMTPAECASHVASSQDGTEIAIVFGREHAGLTNDELLRCHYHIHIPSNPLFSSLNLAQAVQIMTYELRMKCLSSPIAVVETHQHVPATADEIEQFHAHLREVLLEINFLKPSNPTRLIQRLRRMFARIQLDALEVSILRGILSHVQAAISRHQGSS
jgi:tRNA (cytidine32/uridine32-2'-O)-methyltransferase